MSQDLMNYEQMRSLALRGVVRDAIRRVIREDGLPGAHHFYITFLTRFPGVEIDESLSEKYPEDIPIVLQHQFWDLAANADDFEVTLKFGGIPQ
ncbi:MAG: ClpXP protease specificity-enhancing factor SspB, partial [Pseudomonadota bacterium]